MEAEEAAQEPAATAGVAEPEAVDEAPAADGEKDTPEKPELDPGEPEPSPEEQTHD